MKPEPITAQTLEKLVQRIHEMNMKCPGSGTAAFEANCQKAVSLVRLGALNKLAD